jgi:hypothetical protein
LIYIIVIGGLLSLLAKLRLMTVPAGEELPLCQTCRYDLKGLAATALCPECGGVDRARAGKQHIWKLVPAPYRIAVVWFMLVAAPVVTKTAQGIGAWTNYRAFEPSAAAWRNGFTGYWESLARPGFGVALCVAFLALATVWWKPVIGLALSLVVLVYLAVTGYDEALNRPWVVRVGYDGSNAAGPLAIGFFVMLFSTALRLVLAGVIWLKTRLFTPDPQPEP